MRGFGRVLVPINYRLKKHEGAYILHHSGARLLLVEKDYWDLVADLPVPQKILLDGSQDDLLYDFANEPPSWPVDENHHASIKYTSGTTAMPK